MEAKRAVDLEPLSLVNNSILTSVYLFARRNDRALEQARKTMDLDPSFGVSRYWLALAYLANGMNEEALALKTNAITTAIAYAKTGRKPPFQNLRSDPRFGDLVRRIGLGQGGK